MGPILYVCKCGAKVGADFDFINSLIPPVCPVCLEATWLVRPDEDGPLVCIPASPMVNECLSHLNAQSGMVRKMAKEVIKHMNAPKPGWN